MKTFLLIFSFLSVLTLSSWAGKPKVDASTVDSLDIERYVGRWYEIVRFDTWFENDVDHVTAHYSLRPDGRIDIVNRSCKNGRMRKSTARGKRSSDATPGKLRVSFFLWFYSDYNIIELDHDGYQYAVVGSDDGDYFWILSRTPFLDPDIITMLLRRAERRGYDMKKVVFCSQSEPRPDAEH